MQCLNDDIAREIEYVCEHLFQIDSVAISKDAIAFTFTGIRYIPAVL